MALTQWKKARVEDAMHATRAAVKEGIVPGGGVAYIRCLPALENLGLEGEEAVGANIVKRMLEEPIRQIMFNAGQEGSIVVEKVKTSKEENYGFNAARRRHGRYVLTRISHLLSTPFHKYNDIFAEEKDRHYRQARWQSNAIFERTSPL
jgi:hypothetical protein